MTFTESISVCFKKYVDFSGRGVRSEFWWFYLFTIVAGIVFDIVDVGVNAAIGFNSFGVLGSIFSLAVFLPTLAATARRLHDTNRSGWWQLFWLVGLIPVVIGMVPLMNDLQDPSGLGIGLIIIGVLATLGLVILLIVWLATDSDQGSNRFGPNPKDNYIGDTFS